MMTPDPQSARRGNPEAHDALKELHDRIMDTSSEVGGTWGPILVSKLECILLIYWDKTWTKENAADFLGNKWFVVSVINGVYLATVSDDIEGIIPTTTHYPTVIAGKVKWIGLPKLRAWDSGIVEDIENTSMRAREYYAPFERPYQDILDTFDRQIQDGIGISRAYLHDIVVNPVFEETCRIISVTKINGRFDVRFRGMRVNEPGNPARWPVRPTILSNYQKCYVAAIMQTLDSGFVPHRISAQGSIIKLDIADRQSHKWHVNLKLFEKAHNIDNDAIAVLRIHLHCPYLSSLAEEVLNFPIPIRSKSLIVEATATQLIVKSDVRQITSIGRLPQ